MDCERLFAPSTKTCCIQAPLVSLDENCKEGVTGMCGCNCIIKHILLYFSTYCPLLGIIILLVKVIFKCRSVFILLPTIQKSRLVRSPLPFPLRQRYGLPDPPLDHRDAKNVSVSICRGFHPIRWGCCTQDAVEALRGGEWRSLTFPCNGLPCAHRHVWCPHSLPYGKSSHGVSDCLLPAQHNPHWASE